MRARLEKIELKEISAFLGCGENRLPPETAAVIRELSKDILQHLDPRVCCRIFDKSDSFIQEKILIGRDINSLLSQSHKVVLFGATLGSEADLWLKKMQIVDLSRAVVLDAVLSAAIEQVCDNLAKDLENEYGFLTDRFSPGYGDLPNFVNREIESVLKLGKSIGLTFSDSGLMIPQKSVTAILGVADAPQAKCLRGCEYCNLYESCTLRKDERTNEKP